MIVVGGRVTRVLVVEDDLAIGAGLVRGLSEAGFAPELQTTGAGAVERVLEGYDAVVLDLSLPGRHGLEVLAALRTRTSAPVIVLTAALDLQVRLDAFAAGAADFVPKPFFVAEVAARLRRHLGVSAPPSRRRCRVGDVDVDRDARTATLGGIELALTPYEFNLLDALLERRGHAISRHALRDGCLSADGDVSDRTVDSHLGRLRRKLGPAGEEIRTVWGVGYRINAEPSR